MVVQLKDIVNKFEPDIVWTDGDWDHNSDFWNSNEFIAWLYTNSTVKDKVVINGRWGNDMNWKKGPFVGNFMALEYDGGDDTTSRVSGRNAGALASRSATTATKGPRILTACRCCC
jgi:alpha-L-fucosidase